MGGEIVHVHNCLYFSHIKIFSDPYTLFYKEKANFTKHPWHFYSNHMENI